MTSNKAPRGKQSNILKVWRMATEGERANGERWYFDANQFASDLARRYDFTIEQAAGVIAALSPNVAWLHNRIDAETLLDAARSGRSIDSFKVRAYGANKLKAWRMAQGESPDAVLGGPKVKAFYANILDPHHSEAITIDTHAYSIWRGKRFTTNESPTEQRAIFGPAVLRDAAEDYKSLAAKLGIKPWQLQATTWETWRRIHLTGKYKHITERAA